LILGQPISGADIHGRINTVFNQNAIIHYSLLVNTYSIKTF